MEATAKASRLTDGQLKAMIWVAAAHMVHERKNDQTEVKGQVIAFIPSGVAQANEVAVVLAGAPALLRFWRAHRAMEKVLDGDDADQYTQADRELSDAAEAVSLSLGDQA